MSEHIAYTARKKCMLSFKKKQNSSDTHPSNFDISWSRSISASYLLA